jgi:tetratricopeptide (TPR) repeat protein
VHYRAGEYTAAARQLQAMIALFPARRDYWLQLSGIYAETGEHFRSLAVLELAYLNNLLEDERDLISLAQHYLHTGLPYKAGEMLDRALNDGLLKPSAENWNLLIDAWLTARERQRALATVERALETYPRADLHLRHARLLADAGHWPQVLRATEHALSDDALEAPGEAHLLAGIAHYRLRQPRRAHSHFERARAFDHSRGQARQWLRHLTAPGRHATRDPARHLSP